ncbi:SMI1/KNR4 family protein [Actinospica sp. MGRD01-02]|uniref:SMI1/KNR4 family protein n=1 Tax=Actinospica acidithermotolerans TaxID=2828514 RepID=A0A941EDM0_9ACTN|nr:SMI1/KNR4 family protein [Actinospica acidithermotolerans]MBR7828490.1 SMI1/KNR4 family protein [Actinospica acidithermotolerans]
MRDVLDFRPLLGEPLRAGGEAELHQLEERWGISLPPDFLLLLAAYGDATWEGYFQVSGPRTLGFVGSLYESVADWNEGEEIDLLPADGGLLLWGSTVEGDLLCLEPAGDRWRVLVSSKVVGQIVRHEMDFSDWLHAVLTAVIDTDWLPSFERYPLAVEEYGKLPFGLPMGAGPAGAATSGGR